MFRATLNKQRRGRHILRYPLACIAHKSLEIFERCRLWQQNSPATPDYSAALLERIV
jgi:hypothetical protein